MMIMPTCTKRLIGPEMAIINTFGGFVFELSAFKFNVIYRIFYVLLASIADFLLRTRSHAVTRFMNTSVNNNINLFARLALLANVLSRFVDMYLSLQHSTFLYALLNKRFCAQQLLSAGGDDDDHAAAANAAGNDEQEPKRVPRTTIARRLFVALLVSSALYTYGREYALAMAQLSKGTSLNSTELSPPMPPLPQLRDAINATAGERALLARPRASMFLHMLKNSSLEFYLLVLVWPAVLVVHETIQFSGSTIIVMYLTTVSTDLMYSSARCLTRQCQLTDNGSGGGSKSDSNSATHQSHAQARDFHLEIGFLRDTLEHVREMLIAVRETLGLSWLLMWLKAITHMCLLTAFMNATLVNNLQFLSLLMFSGIVRRVFSVSILLVSYYWLHEDAKYIRCCVDAHVTSIKFAHGYYPFSIEQQQQQQQNNSDTPDISCSDALEIDATADHTQQISAKQRKDMSTHIAELLTIRRLLSDIEQQWPTDWLKPSFNDFISANILAIVLVTTLQQMVDASLQMNLRNN